MHIVQISDTHLIHQGGTTNENFTRLAEFVNRLAPDLVINTGDIVALAPDVAEDRIIARELHQVLDAPVLMLPGNHDVGEVGDKPWMGIEVTSARLGAYREVFGEDRWFRILDEEWALVGLDSQLFGSGLPEEREQWGWLEGAVAEIGDRSVLLFLHKPLWSPIDDLAMAADHPISLGELDRVRLLGLVGEQRVRAVGSGHLHHYRQVKQDGILEVWAPSTAFVPQADQVPASFGLGQLGVVEYRSEGPSVKAWFRSIPGLPEIDYLEIPEVGALMERIRSEAATTA